MATIYYAIKMDVISGVLTIRSKAKEKKITSERRNTKFQSSGTVMQEAVHLK